MLPATDNIEFNEEIIKIENSRVEYDINQQQEYLKDSFCDKYEEDNNQQEILQLVKNPFFRKSCNQKKFIKQHRWIERKNKVNIK